MRERIDELARLDRRIAELRHRIDDAKARASDPWGSSERVRILDLLDETLRDLEARRIALEHPGA